MPSIPTTLSHLVACLLLLRPILSQCEPLEEFFEKNADQLREQTLAKIVTKENSLGSGNFGSVYSCSWGDAAAAYKQVQIDARNPRETYLQEAQMLIRVREIPGALKLFGCLETNGFMGFFTERLLGDLSDKIKEFSNLKPKQRVWLYKGLADTFAAIHAIGIIHNDIKIDNIMTLNEEATILKAIDYGLACDIGKLCVGGTRHFAAPEKVEQTYQSRKSQFLATVKIDTWAFLIMIAVLENKGGAVHMQKVDSDCINSKMTVDCHKGILKNLKKMMKKSPSDLMKYVVASLTYDADERPNMEQISAALANIHQKMKKNIIL